MKILFLTDDRKGANEALIWLNMQYDILGCVFDVIEGGELVNTCVRNSIPTFSSSEIYSQLNTISKPDLIVSYLFRHKILREMISFCPINKYGYRNIINFHPAPLPDAKGVGMSSQAIIQGFSEWGITVHYVNEKFDDGDIIEVSRFEIPRNIISIELQFLTQIEQLKLLKRIIPEFESGGLIGYKQANSGRYYSNKLLQSFKQITGKESRAELDKKIHGLFYPPYDGAYVIINGQKYTLVDEVILSKISELYQRYEDDLFKNLS